MLLLFSAWLEMGQGRAGAVPAAWPLWMSEPCLGMAQQAWAVLGSLGSHWDHWDLTGITQDSISRLLLPGLWSSLHSSAVPDLSVLLPGSVCALLRKRLCLPEVTKIPILESCSMLGKDQRANGGRP